MSKDVSLVKVQELGELLVRKDETGRVMLVQKKVTLELGLDYVAIQGKATPTVRAYDRMNQFAGCHVVMPQQMFVDGALVGNPHVVRDSTGAIVRAMARRMVIGRSPLGQMCVVDYVADFDVAGYFRRDFLAKIKRERSLGRVGTQAEGPPPNCPDVRWGFYPVDQEFGIWFDQDHDAFLDLLETTSQRRQFAVRIVQGIAKRNALAMHPAFGGGAAFLLDYEEKKRSDGTGTYRSYTTPPTHDVTVTYFRTDNSREEVEALAHHVAKTGEVPPTFSGRVFKGEGSVADEALDVVEAELAPEERPQSQPDEECDPNVVSGPKAKGKATVLDTVQVGSHPVTSEDDDMDPSRW